MCTMSVVGDYYSKKWSESPSITPWNPMSGGVSATPYQPALLPGPSRQEFDDLRKEVLEMKELLKAAKMIDDKIDQKDCEQEEKIALLKSIAEMVGVDLSEIFGK